MLLAAMVLVLGLSGQAMAYFADGDLIQVVYQKGGTYEVATDLGPISGITGGLTTAYSGPTIQFTANPVVAGAGAFSGANWSDLQVAYFVKESSANGFASNAAWTSGPQAGQKSGLNKWATFNSVATSVQNVYLANSTGAHGTLAQNNLSSYITKMDLNNPVTSAGMFGGFIPLKNGEANLAALAGGSNSYVDLYLYYYSSPNAANNGLKVADIRMFANGTSEIVGTPIPPSVLLLGSGLIGLVGIRRKQAA